MSTFRGFVKKHLKKFIIGAVVAVITLGGSVVYTIIKKRGGGS